jgi:hypothetical protein
MERENIQDHGQIWSNVNFTANPKVAADLMSNMCRPEYKHYTKNILRKEGFSYLPHLHRYRSLKSFQKDIEYEAFVNCKTVEDITINYSTA